MGDHSDLLSALSAIDPAAISYQEWVDCGMALHESGFSWRDWEDWSRRDAARFHEGECERKWRGFGRSADRVTSGTVVRMAQARGWSPAKQPDEAFGWDDAAPLAADPSWVEDRPIDEGGAWDPARQLSDYIGALFDDDDHVGYVCESRTRDGRAMPANAGHWDRTAAQLRRELDESGDVGAVMGDWDPAVGAWIRFNPLDGQGCGNANVTEYRYALVESDTLPVEKQRGMIEAMRLPCAALVSSGGKSVHAIVRVDAGTDYDLYRKRVERLYAYCAAHGFEPDRQNKNPSRLSRMPGVTRGGRRQLLLATNVGCDSWAAWEDWVAESEDDLPEEVELSSVWGRLPALSEPLIGTEGRGLLRRGHKMLVAGPSKAGKSVLLAELAMAVASGGEWLGYPCSRGRVLYVNLEIDAASCYRRFEEIARERPAEYGDGAWVENLVVWNLRGHAVPMDRLAPRLIHRARGRGYSLVIIDPIYKVITGDENSASEMALFCNQFDRICTALGTSVVYCHHHSKGSQGQKRSMDRASGSGVFARDPDAMLDVAPLRVPEDSQGRMGEASAWRVSATLREFATPEPVDLFFRYPVHILDRSGQMRRWKVEGEDPWAEQQELRRKGKAAKDMADQAEKNRLVRDAVRECADDGVTPTRANVLERIGEFGGRGVTDSQLKAWTNPNRNAWAEFGVTRNRDGVDVVTERNASNDDENE